VHWNALDANLDAELLVDVVGVAVFTPGGEPEPAAVILEDAHIHHALPIPWVVEDDQVLLGEVLEHQELIIVDVELVAEGITEMVGLGVVAVAREPAHRSPTDELILAPSDIDGGRHGIESTGGPGPRVPRIPSGLHVLLAVDHLRKGQWSVLWRLWLVLRLRVVVGCRRS